ncbi:MAG: hypothetical protein JO107_06080 [Hyphomicrobiales bacterium]|nr:hypothetical protein [Hyphomicrobiales bacterium]
MNDGLWHRLGWRTDLTVLAIAEGHSSAIHPIYAVIVAPLAQPYNAQYDCEAPKGAEQDNLCYQRNIVEGTVAAAKNSGACLTAKPI